MAPAIEAGISANRNLLCISNTKMFHHQYLDHVVPDLEPLVDGLDRIVIIPYAAQHMNSVVYDLGSALIKMGARSYISTHRYPGDEAKAIEDASAIYIADGNTGDLVANLHGLRDRVHHYVDTRPDASKTNIIKAIRRKAANGIPIIGSSAGLNVMCVDVRCTNDMQASVLTQPHGEKVLMIDALSLLPGHLRLNPDYVDNVSLDDNKREQVLAIAPELAQVIDHQGESRRERLEQILNRAPELTILALREGAYIRVNGMRMEFKGESGGLIFRSGQEPEVVNPEDDISFLIESA